MDVIATNLANLETAGFKAENMIFTEHLEQTAEGEILSLVHDVGFVRDLSAGPMVGTQSPLDLAIHGQGYFAVETPDGERYTRHGVFQLDADGQIVTTEGNPVLNNGGAAISIPLDTASITITRDGTVSADAQEVGKIKLVTFENPQALSKAGSGLYEAIDQTPTTDSDSEIMQGMVESSNVKGVVEMTRMVDTVRSYQAAAKLADTEHQRILDAIDALVSTA
jgi:flagellar basal-body rod protein FlgF